MQGVFQALSKLLILWAEPDKNTVCPWQLVLPWVKVKCLASKVLALNIKRISSDWLKIYHYPLYML